MLNILLGNGAHTNIACLLRSSSVSSRILLQSICYRSNTHLVALSLGSSTPQTDTGDSTEADNWTIDGTPMSLFNNNRYFNLPWAFATALALWFLFIHTPPFWRLRHLPLSDRWLALHISTAGTLYLVCAHNCCCTPGQGEGHAQRHVWLGRLGLVAGLVSFTIGAVLAWSRLGQSTTLGFSIPITIGGLLQVHAQVQGYRAIRQYQKMEDGPERQSVLRLHIGYMVSLFLLACGVPAAIRLSEALAPNAPTVGMVGLGILIVVFQKMAGSLADILSSSS